MLWFTVWTVLVVGTLVGAFFLGRRLWRSGVALGRELGVAAQTWDVLARRLDELRSLAEDRAGETRPTVLADRDVLRERLDDVRAARDVRRFARAERHRRTWQGWRAYWR